MAISSVFCIRYALPNATGPVAMPNKTVGVLEWSFIQISLSAFSYPSSIPTAFGRIVNLAGCIPIMVIVVGPR